ncbi:hypothetical protein GCM10025868_41690 [Angustibacter aerolatus]|uniref:Uncharacterized protein n=1 Tax=Angustibacter aerolatus TaxID=1162965 RepID=A0ABQ6JLZ3_9ACTN|nr:hypothetical protein GCM10025868_41690 [Angustibacter aerolatus]
MASVTRRAVPGSQVTRTHPAYAPAISTTAPTGAVSGASGAGAGYVCSSDSQTASTTAQTSSARLEGGERRRHDTAPATGSGSRPSSARLVAHGVGGERLDQVLVRAGGERADHATVLALGRHHHHGDVAPGGLLADPADERQPVHDRHVPVDAGQVRAPAGGIHHRQHVEGLLAVGGLLGLVAEAVEHAGHDAPHGARVVDDESTHQETFR